MTNAQVAGFYINDGYALNGNQWHYPNLSIIDAGQSNYLVITPTEYYYSSLPVFDAPTINSFLPDVAQTYRPYIWNGYLGWLVYARYGIYFVYEWGNSWHYARIDTTPVYYNYCYNLCGVRYIDMRRWHFAAPPGPRHHHHHHHHHSVTPSHHGTPPAHGSHQGSYSSSSHRTSGVSVRQGSYTSGSQRTSGVTVRQSRPTVERSSRQQVRTTSGSVSRSSSVSRGSSPAQRSSGRSERRR